MKTTSLLKLFVVTLSMVGTFGCSGCIPKCDPNLSYPEPGSCPDRSKPSGSAGGPCKSWTQNCNGNGELTCIADSCIPCGDHGEVCCNDFNDGCSPGVCDRQPDTYDRCDNTCGRVGQPCCEVRFCGQGTCDNDTNMCTNTTPSCMSGPEYYVGQRNAVTKCADPAPIIAHGNTLAEARTCAQAQLRAGFEFVGDLKPFNEFQMPYEFWYCAGEKFPGFGGSSSDWVYQQADEAVCMTAMCAVGCSLPVNDMCEPQ